MSKKVTQPNFTNCKEATIVVGRDWYSNKVGLAIFVKESQVSGQMLAYDISTTFFRAVMVEDIILNGSK
jgi:hypothetical protein